MALRDSDNVWAARRRVGTNPIADVSSFLASLHLPIGESSCACPTDRRDEHYRTMVEQSELGVVVHVEGSIKFANIAVARFLGFDRPEEMAGLCCWNLIHPEDLDRTLAYLREPASYGSLRECEFRVVQRDGSVAWVGCVGVAIEWEGQPARLVTLVDQTNRRAVREAKRAADEQARRMEAIGRLAGGIAHEFNNKLTTIIGHAELALVLCGDNAAATESLRAIARSAQESAALTRRLLAFGRRQLLQPRAVDLNGWLGTMTPELRRLVGTHVTLDVTLSPDLAQVHIDPGPFEPAVLQLVARARDAMPHGGHLTIETTMVDVTPAEAEPHDGAVPGRQVCVRVTDTGASIGEDARRLIFEPFATGDLTQDTGLELASVFGTIHQSGGWVSVESQPSGGSAFSIYLPTLADPLPVTSATESPTTPATSPVILVVEDQACVREFVQRLLESEGHQVITAADGSEALSTMRARGGAVDLLVCDVRMPGMSGPQVASALRSMRQDLRVVFISGEPMAELADPAITAVRASFLQKPFGADALLGVVWQELTRQ